MDPITKLHPQVPRLLEQYPELSNLNGSADLAAHIGKTLGVQALSGIKGITELPHGAEAAAKAISDYQEKYAPDRPSDAAIKTIQHVAPLFRAAAASPVGQYAHQLGQAYGEGSRHLSDLAGKYLGPSAAGVVGAVADAAPMAITPEGLLGKGAADAAKLAYTTAIEPASAATAPWLKAAEYPDHAIAVTARDPQTGELLSRQALVKRGNTLQSIRMDTRPDVQGKGIGSDLLQKAVSHAHDNGMDFASDTQVSVPAMKTYMKHQGSFEINPAHDEINDDADGMVAKSANGQPMVTIRKPALADDATVDEVPGPSLAKGGEIGTVAGGLADLIDRYAPVAQRDVRAITGGNESVSANAPKALQGLPSKATVPGHGTLDVGPHQPARDAAAAYMKAAGLPYNPPSLYSTVDPQRASKIAQAFDVMQHNPEDPATSASYDAMIKETLAQYQHIKDTGLKVDFISPDAHHHGPSAGGGDPYAASPRLAAEDVKNNNHMWVFPTTGGFGSDATDVSGNPLLRDSGETISGQPATVNDIFRVVHDYFGHVKEGVGFRANGEENAWKQHASMYSDLARPAMTTETRGQNSWVNFGPHGETNRTASSPNTVFAPQKTGLLPPEFSETDPEMNFLHMSNLSDPSVTLDPAYYGTGLKGREAKRGGPKVTSLYPADIATKDIETGLQGKTPYRVTVPSSAMYNANTDPLGLKEGASYNGALDFSAFEDAIKGAGYHGYHVPDAEGLLRGQGRLFGKTPAARLSDAPPPGEQADLSAGFAAGGEVGTALGGLGELIAKYAPDTDAMTLKLPGEAQAISDVVKDKGGITYNPTTGDVHQEGYALPTHGHRSAVTDEAPTAADIHDYMMQHQDAFDEDPHASLHVVSVDNGQHLMSVVHHEPDFESAMAKARTASLPGVNDISSGENFSTTPAVPDSLETDSMSPHPQDVSDYQQSYNSRPSTPWTPGRQTVMILVK